MYFRNEFYFLSNMYPCKIVLKLNEKEYTFSCAESAFQALKDIDKADVFAKLNGFEAKKLGKRQNLIKHWHSVENWNANRVRVMRYVVIAKFEQNPLLMDKLKNIKEPIVEDNNWNDRFWGKSNGIGENWLGKILTGLKTEITDELIYG